MKKLILLTIFMFAIFVSLIGTTLSANGRQLKKVEQNGKYGFVNNKGVFVINPIFESAEDFHEVRAAVWQYGKWGFINSKGKFIVKPQYDIVGDFKEGRAYVVHKTEEVIEPLVKQIALNVAYINKRGKIIIPFYEGGVYFYNYSDGLVAIQNGDATYCSYMDKKGKIVLDKNYFEKTGWINTTDTGCHSFHEGLLNVYKYTDDTYKTRTSAYMNKKGEIIYSKNFIVPEEVEPLCDFDSFSEGMAIFRVNWKYGFISKKFEEIIPPIYDFAYAFKNGLALVENDGKKFYIDKQRNFAKEDEHD